MTPLEILEKIQAEIKEHFDNDPAIMRTTKMIIGEFKKRSEEIENKN